MKKLLILAIILSVLLVAVALPVSAGSIDAGCDEGAPVSYAMTAARMGADYGIDGRSGAWR